MLLFAVALAVSAPASHPSCDEVRRVRAAAIAQGLDDSTLRILEGQACQVPGAPGGAGSVGGGIASPHLRSQGCIDLQIMSLLGRTAGDTRGLDEVNGLLQIACTMGLSDARLNWKSGITARTAAGGWNWPSGITARTATGAWNWPNGVTARAPSGSWNWPSGITALTSTGRWNMPNGVPVAREQLLTDACARDRARCAELATFASWDADLGTAAIIALVWPGR